LGEAFSRFFIADRLGFLIIYQINPSAMKKSTILWATTLLALFAIRCTTETNDAAYPATDLYSQDPEVYDYLDCQGFDMTDVKLFDEHVQVEGDLLIRLDEIRSMIEQRKRDAANGRASQHVTNTGAVVGFFNVDDITFFIDASVGPIDGDWEAAIRTGTQNWENLPFCRVDFTEVTTAAAADIVFYDDNSMSLPACARSLGSLDYAMAEFPGAGQPGRWISINSSDVSITQSNRETVIRHELGHALGFRHNNPISGGEQVNYIAYCGNDILGANYLVGTPASDGASVMVPSFESDHAINLSYHDNKAATFLYPAGYTPPEITNVSQYYKTSTTNDISFTMLSPQVRMYRYRVERLPPWSSTPVQSAEYSNTSDHTFWLLNVPHGTWNFRITSLTYTSEASMEGYPTMVTVQ
jgi:hypothetical protein